MYTVLLREQAGDKDTDLGTEVCIHSVVLEF